MSAEVEGFLPVCRSAGSDCRHAVTPTEQGPRREWMLRIPRAAIRPALSAQQREAGSGAREGLSQHPYASQKISVAQATGNPAGKWSFRVTPWPPPGRVGWCRVYREAMQSAGSRPQWPLARPRFRFIPFGVGLKLGLAPGAAQQVLDRVVLDNCVGLVAVHPSAADRIPGERFP